MAVSCRLQAIFCFETYHNFPSRIRPDPRNKRVAKPDTKMQVCERLLICGGHTEYYSECPSRRQVRVRPRRRFAVWVLVIRFRWPRSRDEIFETGVPIQTLHPELSWARTTTERARARSYTAHRAPKRGWLWNSFSFEWHANYVRGGSNSHVLV